MQFNVDLVEEKKFTKLRNYYLNNPEFNIKNC